jgi:peroxiredoxin
MRLCRLYDVEVTNLLIAKLVDRVTYVIGKDGIIKKAFAKVKPESHASEVLALL